MPIFNPPEQAITEAQVTQIVDNKIAALPAPTASGDGTVLYTWASSGNNNYVAPITVDVTGYSEIIIDFRLTPNYDTVGSTTSQPVITFNGDTGANYSQVASTSDGGPTTYTNVNSLRVTRVGGVNLLTAKVDILLAGGQNAFKSDSYNGVANGYTRTGNTAGSWTPATAADVTSLTIGELNNSFYTGSNSSITVTAK